MENSIFDQISENSKSSERMRDFDTIRIIVIAGPLTLIAIAILLGNLLVVLAVITQRSLRTIPNAYIVSLAFADISVGCFILPLNIIQLIQGEWRLGRTLCHIWLTADVTLCTVSILHLCVIAVDRYRSITDGVQYMQRRSLKLALLIILGVWIIAFWISSPPILGWNNWSEKDDDENLCQLTDQKGYVIHSALGSLIFPTVLMVVLYMRIYNAIQRRLKERQKMETLAEFSITDPEPSPSSFDTLNKPEESTSSGTTVRKGPSIQIRKILKAKARFSLTRERKAARTLGIIMGSFICCWLPFAIAYILGPFLPLETHIPLVLIQIVTWMGYINSALNPIIYTIFSTDFQKGFKRILGIR